MAREMEAMKKMLVKAGLNPAVPAVLHPDQTALDTCISIEVEPSKLSKKRLPSGSPDDKMLGSTSSGSGSGDKAMEEGDGPKKDDWRKIQHKKGRNDAEKVSKKEAKKARRLARAKESRLSVNAKGQEPMMCEALLFFFFIF